MPSFDVVCEFDAHEMHNSVDQARRELTTRFDFKGVSATIDLAADAIKLTAETEFQLAQMLDILNKKVTKRQIDLQHLLPQTPVCQGSRAEQSVLLQQGIDAATAKQVVQAIKTSKIKVQASIQGDKVRVSGKKRDDLQQTISLLREQQFARPLNYLNFRD